MTDHYLRNDGSCEDWCPVCFGEWARRLAKGVREAGPARTPEGDALERVLCAASHGLKLAGGDLRQMRNDGKLLRNLAEREDSALALLRAARDRLTLWSPSDAEAKAYREIRKIVFDLEDDR